MDNNVNVQFIFVCCEYTNGGLFSEGTFEQKFPNLNFLDFYFWFKYNLGQKYYVPQVRPNHSTISDFFSYVSQGLLLNLMKYAGFSNAMMREFWLLSNMLHNAHQFPCVPPAHVWKTK